MHRRRFLALTVAGAGGAAIGAERLLAADRDSAPEPPPSADNDDEVEDPRSGSQRIFWTVDTDEPLAALTFDDGPHPDLTPRILDTLDRYGVKATFMAMGYAAAQYPDVLAAVVAAGHEVGHHSWRHLNCATNNDDDTRVDIETGARIVEEVAGVPVRLFRPPKGRLSEAAVRVTARLGHDIVLWSVTRGALAWRDPTRIASHIVEKVGPGDIIDLHDGIGRGSLEPESAWAAELTERRDSEIRALPRIIEGVAARGMRLGTVSELMSVQRLNSGAA